MALSKTYFSSIAFVQEVLLWTGLANLVVLPITLAYFPSLIPEGATNLLFTVSLTAVFLVMSIRPLADLFPAVSWLRPLVILRKGFGVFSASIIVSFMLMNIMTDAGPYLSAFFSAKHWSLGGYHILAPLGDISALILLITSNKFSKRILGGNWKRVQKLAYMYFYSGALYEYLVLGQAFAFWFALAVFALSAAAFIVKRTEYAPRLAV